MGIEIQVEAVRSAFNAAQQQVLHGVEADGAQAQGVLHGVVDLLVREILHESEHPYEFPLATLAHPGFQLPAQRRILLGQFPSRQGRGLVQGPGLPFQQRQVVDGVEDEIVLLIRAGMPGDDLSSAADHHPVHVALHQHVPVAYGHRHRVIIGAVPHQGQRTHPAGRLVAGVVGRGWQRQQRVQVPLHPLADGLGVSPQHGVHPLQAPPLQVGIQRLKTLHRRYRHQEVAPRVAHHPLDIPLVIALAGTTEPVLEQVVGLQLGAGPGALPASMAQYLRHRQLGVALSSILRTVSRCRSNTREASRTLIPSTRQARRTRKYIST